MSEPPTARQAWVRLTEPAIDDLHALSRKDPQIVRWCLKKMLLLERDPMAGEGLLGLLIGFRRLVVSDRHWRIVWRVVEDDADETTIDIAEVWAAGARADSEIYQEMERRVATLGDNPRARQLHDVVVLLGRTARSIESSPEPEPTEPLPAWLVTALTTTVGLPPEVVQAMTHTEAMNRLQAHWSTPPNT